MCVSQNLKPKLKMKKLASQPLPVDVVFHPSWWNKHVGICFDEDFFYDPRRRVSDEQLMEQTLYDRFGDCGLGLHRNEARPEIGAVHLAAGYLLSEMLGCRIEYFADSAPQVICAHREELEIDEEAPFRSPAFKRLQALIEELKARHGYVTGDINWGGVLNLAMDLKGENVLMDMMMDPEGVKRYFAQIGRVVERFFSYIKAETGTSSISVNRIARLLDEPIYIHSECSHTMISEQDYEDLLLDIDIEWSKKYQPYGIHYCGKDPHRHAAQFAQIPHLAFLDLGWGGDVKTLREALPETFFSLRLNPVEINDYTSDELRQIITERVEASGDLYKTGICCVNMDGNVSDERVKEIYRIAEELKVES